MVCIARHSGAHQERDAGRQETSERRREGERAGAAFGAVLLRQPQR